MPSLQLGVDVVLIFVVVSPLDGDERLIAVNQLSTDVNICVCTTRDSSLLPRCRVQTTTHSHVEREAFISDCSHYLRVNGIVNHVWPAWEEEEEKYKKIINKQCLVSVSKCWPNTWNILNIYDDFSLLYIKMCCHSSQSISSCHILLLDIRQLFLSVVGIVC